MHRNLFNVCQSFEERKEKRATRKKTTMKDKIVHVL